MRRGLAASLLIVTANLLAGSVLHSVGCLKRLGEWQSRGKSAPISASLIIPASSST
jgi:hypothetical protein